MSNIKRPPTGQNAGGKKDSKAAKQDAKAEKGYETAFDDIDDDYDEGGNSESDADTDGDAGEETTSRLTRKGRLVTKTKRKLNRDALLKQQRREQLARQAQGRGGANNLQRNVGVKRTRMRNDNDEDDFFDDFDDLAGGNIDMGDFSGGGSDQGEEEQSQGEQMTDEWSRAEALEEDIPVAFDARQMSENNLKAIEIFKEFLEKRNDAIKANEKERLKKMLESMFQQCIKGLHHFPKESRKHQALGKSANICKHALSALARDNIQDVKTLIAIITPRKGQK